MRRNRCLSRVQTVRLQHDDRKAVVPPRALAGSRADRRNGAGDGLRLGRRQPADAHANSDRSANCQSVARKQASAAAPTLAEPITQSLAGRRRRLLHDCGGRHAGHDRRAVLRRPILVAADLRRQSERDRRQPGQRADWHDTPRSAEAVGRCERVIAPFAAPHGTLQFYDDCPGSPRSATIGHVSAGSVHPCPEYFAAPRMIDRRGAESAVGETRDVRLCGAARWLPAHPCQHGCRPAGNHRRRMRTSE